MVLLFLVLLARFVCGDNITLVFTQEGGAVHVQFYGKEEATITNEEAKNFDLLPFHRCRYRLTKRLGKAPDYCYFGRTYFEKELYDLFGFEPVTSEYSIHEVNLIYLTSDNLAYERRVFNNTSASKHEETFVANDEQSMTMIDQRSMNRFAPPKPVKTRVKLYGLTDDDKNATYVQLWGEHVLKTFPKGVKKGNSAVVQVQAKSNVAVEATNFKTTYAYEVVYKNQLKGVVMGDYINAWRRHHYWTYNATDLADGPKFYKEVVKVQFVNPGMISMHISSPALPARSARSRKYQGPPFSGHISKR